MSGPYDQKDADRGHPAETLVALAQLVVTGADPRLLIGETVRATARALGAGRCEVLRPEPGGQELLRVASSDDTACGESDAVPGGVSSVAGYAMLCGAPVVSQDLREEGRFGDAGAPPWDGPVSAVAAPISAEEGLFSVLVAYATGAGVFEDRDALSVSRIASFLGGAWRHLEEQEELRRLADKTWRRHGGRPVEGDPPKGEASRLTPRQLEVLALMAEGCSAKQIASELGVSIHTIHTHQRNLYRALGVTSFAAALRRAGELGLPTPADTGPEYRT